MLVHFGGSRSLVSAPLLARVVQAVVAAGGSVRVGCAAGADRLVVLAALAAGAASRLSVFAVGAASGAGFWSGSALPAVHAAAAAGASVSWLAGGGLQVPLVGRLMCRSRAALRGCSSSVFFLASPSSSGSLAVAGAAVQAGQAVFAFCPFVPDPPRGCSGSWVAGQFVGFSCWSWVPAAVQPSLF